MPQIAVAGIHGGLNAGAVGVANAAFSPTAVAGLKLWLKADAGTYQERTGASATTPASAEGDPVGTWLDQSGQAHHLTAPSDAARPLLKMNIKNGLPAILSDGSNDVLNGSYTLGLPQTIYLVFSRVSVSGYSSDISGQGYPGRNIESQTYTNRIYISGSAMISSFLTLSLGSVGILTGIWNGASSSVRLNNDTPITGNTGTIANTMRIFSSYFSTFANDYFMELLQYDSVLSSANDGEVMSYLNARWAIY